MAGGRASDGAADERIEVSTEEALARMRLCHRAGGKSLAECAQCGEPIPEARLAQPGVRLCIACPARPGQIGRCGRRAG